MKLSIPFQKTACLLLALAMLLSLAACGQNGGGQGTAANLTQPETQVPAVTQTPEEALPETTAAPAQTAKALIVYFSWSSSGNTEKMADTIRKGTGADMLRLEPKNAYPTDYSACGDVAKAERDANARPEIANLPESLSEYDTIFLGYPIWWHTAPMIIGTFLDSFDLTGKAVYPFAQSASMDPEQFANSMDFVRECAKGADVHDGLFVSASDAQGIADYLAQNGFAG